MMRVALGFLLGVVVGVIWYRLHWMPQDAALVLRDVNAWCARSDQGPCAPEAVSERVRALGVWGVAPR